MRIRQIKPEYWSDAVTARLSDTAQLIYIGLWNVADDAGYIEWDVESLGAHLRPYETPRHRVRRIEKVAAELVAAGRMQMLACGHAVIPTLPVHQRLSGASKRVLTEQKKHEARRCPRIPAEARGFPHIPDTERNGIGTVGNGTERNVIAGPRAQESRDPRTQKLECVEGEWVYVGEAVLA